MKITLVTLSVLVAANGYNIDVKLSENGLHFTKEQGSAALDWWQTAVFYQIYPRSFKDSNGDGIGDLKGIIQKLDHLKDMGVTATWLSPIFKSPQIDQGYDISDYRDIDPDYGTLDDLKELIEKAHKLGIKIILDFVPNHTSDQHEWFKLSENKTKGYEDFYIWQNCTVEKNNTVTKAPNNWISNFKDSAWSYNEKRKQCYLHQFAPQQPDLNYRNSKVVQAMKDVLTYWMNLGVDGFRCDAVNFIIEDEELRDEPLSNIPGVATNEYEYLSHIYTLDQDETYEIIYQWRELLDNFAKNNKTETKVMMTEAYTTIDKTMLYYGLADGSRKGAHFPFNFNFITNLSSNFTIADLQACIEKWLLNLPKNYTSNWVLGNHDKHRIATRLGSQYVDAFNMLVAILPGVMVTYNGEEIGMEDGEVTCKQGHDPQAIKDCSTFNKFSRDFERTPFQWENSTNAGFSNATETWLPVSEKYKQVNLAAQNVTGLNSHYHIYKQLLKLRKDFSKTPTFDSLSVVALSANVVQFVREFDNLEYSLIFNVGTKNETVHFLHKDAKYEVLVASNSSKQGDIIEADTLNLGPYDSILLNNTLVPSGASRVTISLVFTANILLLSALSYIFI